MFLKNLVVGQIETNCYIAGEDESDSLAIIDPGAEADTIMYEISKTGKKVSAILLTHGHYDHIYAVNELKKKYKCKIYAYKAEETMLNDTRINLSDSFGYPISVEADIYLSDNEVINEAGLGFKLIATPGHTSGSACYYIEDEKVLFSGDTLFEMSVGRSDFPTGSGSSLIRSVKERLFVLPDNVVVYPGHGNSTEIGFEKKNNVYF